MHVLYLRLENHCPYDNLIRNKEVKMNCIAFQQEEVNGNKIIIYPAQQAVHPPLLQSVSTAQKRIKCEPPNSLTWIQKLNIFMLLNLIEMLILPVTKAKYGILKIRKPISLLLPLMHNGTSHKVKSIICLEDKHM